MDGFFCCTYLFASESDHDDRIPDVELLFSSFLLVCSLITSSTNGYDGSMMNALESEKQWNDFFGKPEGSKLGLFNAIQGRFSSLNLSTSLIVYLPNHCFRT